MDNRQFHRLPVSAHTEGSSAVPPEKFDRNFRRDRLCVNMPVATLRALELRGFSESQAAFFHGKSLTHTEPLNKSLDSCQHDLEIVEHYPL